MSSEPRGDSREFSRARVPVTAEIAIEDRVIMTNRVRDVSLSGLFLELPELAAVGTGCQLTIQLNPPEGPSVRALGRIVRADATGVGIAILELIGLDSLEHLRNLILYHGSDPDRLVDEFMAHDGLQRRR